MKHEMIEIGTMIRVENGPVRKTAMATAELLDDRVTAEHYKVGLPDAAGKIIVLGETMTYLDYYGPWVWYIYKYDEEECRWLPAGVETTKELALTAAHLLED
jgi:hypothetical protein